MLRALIIPSRVSGDNLLRRGVTFLPVKENPFAELTGTQRIDLASARIMATAL
jgi:hypothetical protein